MLPGVGGLGAGGFEWGVYRLGNEAVPCVFWVKIFVALHRHLCSSQRDPVSAVRLHGRVVFDGVVAQVDAL